MHGPTEQGKEKTSMKKKWKLGRFQETESTTGFSLAESLRGRKSLSPSRWAGRSSQGVRAPPAGHAALFNGGFCLSHFFFFFYNIFNFFLDAVNL